MIRKAKKFIGEVRTELSKATWPWDPKEKGIKKYRELIDSTGVVLVAMVMLGAFVALSDFFLVNAVSAFTRTGIEERVRRPAAIKSETAPPAPSAATPPSASAEPAPAEPAPAPAEQSPPAAEPKAETAPAPGESPAGQGEAAAPGETPAAPEPAKSPLP